MTELSLTGRRVLVTRATHQAGKLSDGLRALGAEPVEVPVIEIQPPDSYDALDQALLQLYSYDWLILTSSNTVRALVERSKALQVSITQRFLHVAAIGESTAQAARQAGLTVRLVPEHYVAESLVEALAGRISNKRVLLARAAIARDVIPDGLRAAGANLTVVDCYRNMIPAAAPEQLAKALLDGLDAVAFASSSGVTHLAEVARQAKITYPLDGVAAISIGPITTDALIRAGWTPSAEAKVSDIPGLIAAVQLFFSQP